MDGIKTNGTSTIDKVYQCIVGYFMENGYAPSIRISVQGQGWHHLARYSIISRGWKRMGGLW